MYAPLQSFYKMVGPHWPWSKKKPPLASAAACAPAIEAPGAGRASSRSAACVENAKGTGMQDGKGTTEIRKIGPHMFTKNRSNVFKCDQIILHPDHPRRVNHNIYKMVGLAVARSLQSQSECLQNGWSWYVLIIQSKKTMASASALAITSIHMGKNTSIPDPIQIGAIRETTNFTRVIAPNCWFQVTFN